MDLGPSDTPQKPMEQQIQQPAAAASKESQVASLREDGRRLYKESKWSDAAEAFSRACALLDELHGPASPESADTLVWYGKALLKNAIQSAGLFDGKTMKKKSGVDDDDEEDEEVDELEEAAPARRGGGSSSSSAAPIDDDDDDAISTGEDDDDFTVAWEVLDVARSIYERDESDQGKARLAEVLMLQGDVGLEDDNPTQSIAAYRAALAVKRSYLPATSRELVEVHHLLGLSLESDNKVPEAVAEFRAAKAVLEARRNELVAKAKAAGVEAVAGQAGGVGDGDADSKGKGKGKVRQTDEQAKDAEEVKEINELIPELEEKISDLTTLPSTLLSDSTPLVATELRKQVEQMPVNDLSGLVRKRKAEPEKGAAGGAGEGAGEGGEAAKKARTGQ